MLTTDYHLHWKHTFKLHCTEAITGLRAAFNLRGVTSSLMASKLFWHLADRRRSTFESLGKVKCGLHSKPLKRKGFELTFQNGIWKKKDQADNLSQGKAKTHAMSFAPKIAKWRLKVYSTNKNRLVHFHVLLHHDCWDHLGLIRVQKSASYCKYEPPCTIFLPAIEIAGRFSINAAPRLLYWPLLCWLEEGLWYILSLLGF